MANQEKDNKNKSVDEKEQMLRVGVITSPHGIHGEVKVYPTTDDSSRFKLLKRVYVDNGKELLATEIENVKFFKQMAILKLSLFQTPEEAALYRNRDLWIVREDAVPLEKDEYFICDLIGLSVVLDTGETLGVLSDVLKTGANDVFEVTRTDQTKVLIPYIDDCVRSISLEEKVVLVHLLKGLLDE